MSNYAYFPALNTTAKKYVVQIVSCSAGGCTDNDDVEFDLVDLVKSHKSKKTLNFTTFWCKLIKLFIVSAQNEYIKVSILSSFMLLAIVFSILIIIKNQRDKRRHNKELVSKETLLHEMTRLYEKDDMEIDPATVDLNENLGEGAFGVVRKGVLKPSNTSVAVKMLKGIHYYSFFCN